MPQSLELVQLMLEQENEHSLILLDPQGVVVGWLMGAARTFGYEAAEMIGQAPDRLFTPEDQRRGIPRIEMETATRHGVGEDDRWMVRKDGARIFVAGLVTRMCDAQGKIVGFTKLLRDRTDVRAQIDHLRSQAAAHQREDERKTLLLDTLAHELRNPLGVLSSAAQLIEIAAPREAKLADASLLIRRQVRYLQSLVEDLLELGRVRQAKIRLNAREERLGETIDAALESCSASLRERGQRAESVVPPIVLEADATRLRQVFVNLISNASKFSDPGATIWIKATTEGSEAVVRVEDHGRGIAAELLPRVFDLFAQGASGDDERSGGLGLGLSIVKEYVELHGGSVAVRSEGPGRGSEFIVRLPLRQP